MKVSYKAYCGASEGGREGRTPRSRPLARQRDCRQGGAAGPFRLLEVREKDGWVGGPGPGSRTKTPGSRSVERRPLELSALEFPQRGAWGDGSRSTRAEVGRQPGWWG